MTTKISVPLASVDEDFLRQLKSKHTQHARIDIQVVEMDEVPGLSESDFWDIIHLLDWEADTREAVLQPAVDALARHPIGHIYQFEDMVAEKLHALDTAAHAHAAYPPPRRISEDGFLYVRAAVLSGGMEHYHKVLNTPPYPAGR